MTQRKSQRFSREVMLAHHVFASTDGYQTVRIDKALSAALPTLERIADSMLAHGLGGGLVACFKVPAGYPCATRTLADGSDHAGRAKRRCHTVAMVDAPQGICALGAPPEAFVLPKTSALFGVQSKLWRKTFAQALPLLERHEAVWPPLLECLLGGAKGVQVRGPIEETHALLTALSSLVPAEDRPHLSVLPVGCGWLATDGPLVLLAGPEDPFDEFALERDLRTLDLHTGRCWPALPLSPFVSYMRDLLATDAKSLSGFVQLADLQPDSEPTTATSRQAFLEAFQAAGGWLHPNGRPVLEDASFAHWAAAIPGLLRSRRENLLLEVLRGLGDLASSPERRGVLLDAFAKASDDPVTLCSLASGAGL